MSGADERSPKDTDWPAVLVQAVLTALLFPLASAGLLLVFGPAIADHFVSPSCDDPKGLRLVTEVAVSSDHAFKENAGLEHSAARAIDGDSGTSWVEGIVPVSDAFGNTVDAGNPYGEGQSLRFTLPQNTDLQLICVINGYAKSADLFARNARARQVTIESERGIRISVLPEKAPDQYAAYQSIDFQRGATSDVVFTLTSFRAGSGGDRATDTAVSEVEFWAQG